MPYRAYKRGNVWLFGPWVLFVLTVGIGFWRSDDLTRRATASAATSTRLAQQVKELSDSRDHDNKANAYVLCSRINETKSGFRETIAAIVDLGTNESIKERINAISAEKMQPDKCPVNPDSPLSPE